MSVPSLENLIACACHFGHSHTKWNPKIAPYIYKVEKGIHIFDLTKTRERLMQTCEYLKKICAEDKTILFISTKQQSIPFIENIGKKLDQPVVTKKWIPGLLTNWHTLKKRLQYYLDLKRSFQTGEIEKYTKKEQLNLRKKLLKLDAALGGVAHMQGKPDAIFVVDAVRDHVAVKEANVLHIPVFGICDSNANPDDFFYCIPANDDAVKSVEMILKTVEEELLTCINQKKKILEEKRNDIEPVTMTIP